MAQVFFSPEMVFLPGAGSHPTTLAKVNWWIFLKELFALSGVRVCVPSGLLPPLYYDHNLPLLYERQLHIYTYGEEKDL